MDILIIFYVNVSNLPPKQREEYLKTIRDRMPKHDKIEYMFMGSNHDDVRVIPVKCYLEGAVAETPDNIEELIEELRELVQIKTHN